MSLMVFLLLSAVLAVAVGVLASLLLRSLMKDQRRLEKNTDDAHVIDPCEVCVRPGVVSMPGQKEGAHCAKDDTTQGVGL